jgi:hypothetical protein
LMRVCGRCADSKDLSEFYAGKRYRDGVQPWCKDCYRVYRVETGYSKNLAKSYAREHTDESFREAYVSSRSKRCPECKQSKSLVDCYRKYYRKVHCPDGFASYGKSCDTRKTGRSRIKKSRGLTSAEYDRLFSSPGEKCTICNKIPRTKKRPVVDHFHETGKVRGMLRQRCNTVIGMMHDDPMLLRRAATYLTR